MAVSVHQQEPAELWGPGYERIFAIAEIDGTPVGRISVTFSVATAMVFGSTAPEARGRGVGTALLEWATEQARQRELRFMSISGFLEDDAVPLLENNGFTLTLTQWDLEAPASSFGAPTRSLDGPDPVDVASDRYRDIFARGFDPEALPWVSAFEGDTDEGFLLYATSGEETIGFCHCEVYRDKAVGTILYLGVDPAHRRGGVGRDLVRGAVAEFHNRECSTARIRVEPDNNPGALALYRSEGFTLAKIQRSFERRLT